MQNLSGGELQRVALTMALGQPANVYLIDEPSAYLDSEQRIVAAKARAGFAALFGTTAMAHGAGGGRAMWRAFDAHCFLRHVKISVAVTEHVLLVGCAEL